jgi:hypothetical protein
MEITNKEIEKKNKEKNENLEKKKKMILLKEKANSKKTKIEINKKYSDYYNEFIEKKYSVFFFENSERKSFEPFPIHLNNEINIYKNESDKKRYLLINFDLKDEKNDFLIDLNKMEIKNCKNYEIFKIKEFLFNSFNDRIYEYNDNDTWKLFDNLISLYIYSSIELKLSKISVKSYIFDLKSFKFSENEKVYKFRISNKNIESNKNNWVYFKDEKWLDFEPNTIKLIHVAYKLNLKETNIKIENKKFKLFLKKLVLLDLTSNIEYLVKIIE